jgi:hypothetical protein
MAQGKKESSPRFDRHEQAIFAEHTRSFSENSIEIIREQRQVMQTALDNKNIFAGILKRKSPTIPDQDLARPAVLGGERR